MSGGFFDCWSLVGAAGCERSLRSRTMQHHSPLMTPACTAVCSPQPAASASGLVTARASQPDCPIERACSLRYLQERAVGRPAAHSVRHAGPVPGAAGGGAGAAEPRGVECHAAVQPHHKRHPGGRWREVRRAPSPSHTLGGCGPFICLLPTLPAPLAWLGPTPATTHPCRAAEATPEELAVLQERALWDLLSLFFLERAAAQGGDRPQTSLAQVLLHAGLLRGKKQRCCCMA